MGWAYSVLRNCSCIGGRSDMVFLQPYLTLLLLIQTDNHISQAVGVATDRRKYTDPEVTSMPFSLLNHNFDI